MTRRNIPRLAAAVPLALAVVFAIPGRSAVRGATVAQSGNRVGAARTAALHRMSNGKIALVDTFNAGSSPRLDVINPDGSGLKPLTRSCRTTDCVFRDITWSPDGSKLAFLRGNLGGVRSPSKLSLFMINADGIREKRLARCDSSGCDTFEGSGISWSPDGSQVLLSRSGALTIVNTRTGRLRRITSCAVRHLGPAVKKGCYDSDPAWSPDGSRILFARRLFSRNVSELIVMRADGSGLRRIPSLQGIVATDSVWAPDGRSIVFDSGDRIYSVHPDGSQLRRLVSGPPGSGPGVPSWSPDGAHIVFFSTPRHPYGFTAEVWVMNANGTQSRRLYHSLYRIADWGRPIWSPDGKHIAFSVTLVSRDGRSLRASKSGLFTMDADGRHLDRLNDMAATDEFAWQPIR